ncbi:hypothetical protein BH11PLA2_BH11PLA2_31830 [soil metagenome]
MTVPEDDLPLRPIDRDILEKPPLEEGGLGEFAETIIDQDGELDPDVLDEEDVGVDEG